MSYSFPVIRYGRRVQATVDGVQRMFQPDEAERALTLLDKRAADFLAAVRQAVVDAGGEIVTDAVAEPALAGRRRSPALGPIYDFDEVYLRVREMEGRLRVGVTVCEDLGSEVANKGAYSKIWVRFRLIGISGKVARALARSDLLGVREQTEQLAASVIGEQLALYQNVLRDPDVGGAGVAVELHGQPIVIIAMSHDTEAFDRLHQELQRGGSLRAQKDKPAARALYDLIPLARVDWHETSIEEIIKLKANDKAPSLVPFEDVRNFVGYFWKGAETDGPRRYVGFARSPFVGTAEGVATPAETRLAGREVSTILSEIGEQDRAAVTVSAGIAGEVGGQSAP